MPLRPPQPLQRSPRLLYRWLGWGIITPFLSLPLLAAELSPADQELIRQQQREQVQQQQRQAPAPAIQLPRATAELGDYPADEQPCFPIQRILLQGEAAARFQFALADVQAATGRCLGVNGIHLVMRQVQNALLRQGYITTRVLVPEQDLNQGTLLLTVLPGRIHQIRFVEPVSRRATQANAVPAKPGDILNLRDVEQALENFKRVPTLDVDIQIEPAANEGESDLVIAWQEATPIRLALSLDNSGADATGTYQGSATISLDNLFTLNDLFYLSLGKELFQHDVLGTRNRTLSYSLPLGYWQLGASYNSYRYFQTVAGVNEDYLYSGDSQNSQLTLSRLLYRDSHHKTTLSLAGYHKRSRNFIADTEIELQRRRTSGWTLGLNQRSYLGDSTLDANLSWRRGSGALNALPAPEAALGLGSSRPSIVQADLSLSYPFKLGQQALTASSSWRGQWSKTPLTPQDRFAIGSRYTVRGFDGESSLSAERGWLLRNDLAWALGSSQQALYLGLDYGQVSGPAAGYLAGTRLAGGVLGWRGSLFKSFSYDVFTGWPLLHPDGFHTARNVTGFSLNWQY
ncbi:ShlB/FhaC/HecB family hemolysin secretion/activation protein [Neisseriaceae bacterium TC5R-5]|nr:ShlB/FhaC/HecB family hemolysin secretion/activation protein [Neisseriaceae bacterium TC5R-5]